MEIRKDIMDILREQMVEQRTQEIRQGKEQKELSVRQAGLSKEVRERMRKPHPELYGLVTDFVGCIFDGDAALREELYMQGVKDGVRLSEWLGEVRKEE